MPLTVDDSFRQFQRDTIDLDRKVVENGRQTIQGLSSKLDEILFQDSNAFPKPIPKSHIMYGSFQRGTKIRELDEINLLLCLDLEGARESRRRASRYLINTGRSSERLRRLSDGDQLNSTALLLQLEELVREVPGFLHAHLHGKGKAVALQLKNHDWRFDLVPCFKIEEDFYLMPDGSGSWIPTQPSKGNLPIMVADQAKEGKLVPLIRLLKYWNRHNPAPTIPAYVFELMVTDFANSRANLSLWTDFNILAFFGYLSNRIWKKVTDPNEIWPDLNPFSEQEKKAIMDAVEKARGLARIAIDAETQGKDHKLAIAQWREIFGQGYPKYG